MMILNEYINGLLGTLHIEPFITWVDVTFYIFQLAFQREFSSCSNVIVRYLMNNIITSVAERDATHTSSLGIFNKVLQRTLEQCENSCQNDTQLQFKIATYATTTVGSYFLLLHTGCAHGLCVYFL